MANLTDQSFLESHRAIAEYFSENQNRVRNLIGTDHWPTDGEYKEILVRKVLRNHLPTRLRVGRGFARFEDRKRNCPGPSKPSSGQLDVLVIEAQTNPLFEEGDL